MKPNKPRVLPRVLGYLFFFAICLAGLMMGVTTRSSSRNQETAAAANLSDESQRESALFYAKDGRRGSTTAALSYRNETMPPSRDRYAGPSLFQTLAQIPAKIAPQVLADTSDGKSVSVVILLADQADVSAAYAMTDPDARGWYVYNTLTQHAARTQGELKSFLKVRGIPYQSYWAANMIVADADRSLVEQLAARADVAHLDSNRPARWIEDPKLADLKDATNKPNATTAVESGVTNVNAPAVWALGFTGQGMVVGNEDTGMRWDHNALKAKYRGWDGSVADHNFNWHDSIHSGGGSCGFNSLVPCDDQGHGTHTTGTTVGDDGAGNQVGVAPGAKWIGCRNMDQGNGTPATYTECFQFFIAPTDLAGNNANAALRPHVINNSWGCPVSEGCTTGAELQTIVNNTQAAGIFVVVSAGNSGSACSTVADAPAFYDAAFSVGAISGTTNVLASFSSRGPGTLAPNLLKPNISAPGVSVRSTLRTGLATYGSMSGTSMAGPHVAGVVALLWSARPGLVRNIALTKQFLQNTANPGVTVSPAQTCGGTLGSTPGLSQIPNNSFGYGRVDVLAAYNASAPTAGLARISGQVANAEGQPLSGATVTVSSGSTLVRAITDASGFYAVDGLTVGEFYTVTPARANFLFNPANRSIALQADKTDAVFTAAAAGPNANPLDSAEFFVRQQYVDVLGREPDQGGLDYWSAQLRGCGSDQQCLNRQRIGISAAFFVEQEFQLTGSYIDDVYAGALGRQPAFSEYSIDRQEVVGGANLDASKTAFARSFVQRPEFITKYQASTTAEAFVNALVEGVQLTGVDLNGERSNLLNLYQNGGNTIDSRAAVVRAVADNATFKQSQYNSAFVLTEYFSYLRRDPDQNGYHFWLNILNTGDPGNYRGMVCSFVTSTEYQSRFSPVVTHSNAECSGQ